MKKILFAALLITAASSANAQYAKINQIISELEQRKGINSDLKNISIDDKKFVRIEDFEDHTERQFIVVKGNQATYAEVFDDKKTGQSSSNVFSGDVIRTNNNILSFRFDKLEGQKIALPIAKTMRMLKQKKVIYLVDVNTKDRWIDEVSVGEK